jgi:hypothetical protein
VGVMHARPMGGGGLPGEGREGEGRVVRGGRWEVEVGRASCRPEGGEGLKGLKAPKERLLCGCVHQQQPLLLTLIQWRPRRAGGRAQASKGPPADGEGRGRPWDATATACVLPRLLGGACASPLAMHARNPPPGRVWAACDGARHDGACAGRPPPPPQGAGRGREPSSRACIRRLTLVR